MVFAFHHSPSAMSGTDGTSTSSAPCNSASPTSSASQRECRRIPALHRELLADHKPTGVEGARLLAPQGEFASRPLRVTDPRSNIGGFMASDSIGGRLACPTFQRLSRLGFLALELHELVDGRVIARPHLGHAPA